MFLEMQIDIKHIAKLFTEILASMYIPGYHYPHKPYRLFNVLSADVSCPAIAGKAIILHFNLVDNS